MISDAESEDLGLEPSSGVMEVSKQYPGELLRSFLRTIGSQVVTTGDTQGALGEVRLLELVPDLATKYSDKITTRRSILRSEHQCRDESIGGGDGLIDGWPRGARGRHHGPEVPSPRVRSHRRGIVEQSEALGTGPIGRGHVSHTRTARRHESPGAPRSTVDRETKQLELKRTRSESQPTGREALRQERNPVEVARREPVRERKQKGEQDLGEHRTDSWQQRVAGREETQTNVGACSESGKRQTLNEEPPVTRLRLPPRRGWLRDLPTKDPFPQHGVYIGRSHGAFYQPQGWRNPFKPDPRKGKQRLQEVLGEFGNHCLWFRWGAVRKLCNILTSKEASRMRKRLRVWSTPLRNETSCTFPASL